MGEEYGEDAPFQYFVSHGDERLVEAVRTGRREECAGFGWRGEAPDPQDPGTFERSKLRRDLATPPHTTVLAYYRELLRLRAGTPGLACCEGTTSRVDHDDKERTVLLVRQAGRNEAALALHFGSAPARVTLRLPE